MSFLREPLLHFLLLGAALFALFDRVRGDAAAATSREIVVSAGTIESLSAGFARAWQRPPTPDELSGLIEDHVTEEVLYREALALGLERDDSIVRRRLRQKLEFLAEDLAGEREPGEAELQRYLDEHRDAFRSEPRFDLDQVYLSSDRRGARAETDARALAERLSAQDLPDLDALGDPLPIEASLRDVAPSDLARLFGDEFASRVRTLEPGAWHGPIASGYGLHVVRIRSRAEGRLPALAEIRDEVEREWRVAQRIEARAAFLAGLRSRYSVAIERPAPGIPAPEHR